MNSLPSPLVEFSGTGSSFFEFVRETAPHALTMNFSETGMLPAIPHGTTIVAVQFAGGVVMAGDRRATVGSMIANRQVEKVFPADDSSVIGIAGTAGLALELVRLFQLELEHYEKIEGSPLSLDGKGNRLGSMLRNNLPMAMQGLTVLPLFAGYDDVRGVGRIFSFDVTGGRYEETSHHSVGSGSVFARGALKKLWRPNLTAEQAVRVCIEALWDAADDDSATAGPDAVRKIWPIVATVSSNGFQYVDVPTLKEHADQVIAARSDDSKLIVVLEPGEHSVGNSAGPGNLGLGSEGGA